MSQTKVQVLRNRKQFLLAKKLQGRAERHEVEELRVISQELLHLTSTVAGMNAVRNAKQRLEKHSG